MKHLDKLLLVLTLITALWVMDRSRFHAQRHQLAKQTYEDIYYLPPPHWLQLGSLGYRTAAADLIWLRALVYFGEELSQRGEVAHLYNYADAMLALDPDFKKVYHWVASCALYRTGEVTADDALKAIAYLEAGVRRFPDDGKLAWDTGAFYTYELPPLLMEDMEKREWARQQGLPHLQMAARRGAGPTWLVLSNASDLVNLGRKESAIRQLTEVYSTVEDPDVRERIEQRIARLQGEAHAEAMRRTLNQFRQAKARDFPYLSDALYMLTGPRPPFDGNDQLLRYFDPAPDRLDVGTTPDAN